MSEAFDTTYLEKYTVSLIARETASDIDLVINY